MQKQGNERSGHPVYAGLCRVSSLQKGQQLLLVRWRLRHFFPYVVRLILWHLYHFPSVSEKDQDCLNHDDCSRYVFFPVGVQRSFSANTRFKYHWEHEVCSYTQFKYQVRAFFKVYFSNCLWICYMLMNETESFVTTKKIRMSMNHMGRQGKA